MKLCNKCFIAKELIEFGNHSQTKDKRHPSCKVCENTRKSNRYNENKSSHLKKCKEWRESNRDKNAETTLRYYNKNKENISKKNQEWSEKNRVSSNRIKSKYVIANPDKIKVTANKWRTNNLVKMRFYQAKRRSAKLNQTPTWSNLDLIKTFYMNCPSGMEVDHIIPLQGKNVRGLHVIENLQYLSIKENRTKGNKYVR